jgi:hypothetical protein
LKCEDFHNLIIEELYDEIAPEDHLRLRGICGLPGMRRENENSPNNLAHFTIVADRRTAPQSDIYPENRLTIRDHASEDSASGSLPMDLREPARLLLLILAAGNTRISYKMVTLNFIRV